VSATPAALAGGPARATAAPAGAIRSVYRAERRKLLSQLGLRLVALVCALGPFVFGAVLKVQSGSPTDTLYGVWVHSSGFALSLVLLAFAGMWGFPLIAGIVAGDLFSSEDRYGTWKLVLTRSCTRRDVFAGKLLAAAVLMLGFLGLTAAASLAAGVLLVGGHSLVSLSGTPFSPGRMLVLVLAGWALCAPPMLAFGSLAVLFSVITRNGIMGVIGPAICALAMQLLLLVGSGVWVHLLLVASAFNGWHALLTTHPFYGQLLIGIAVSVVWSAACLLISWWIVRRRDFAGTPVSRRQGWLMPVRVALALAAVVALLANCGQLGARGDHQRAAEGEPDPGVQQPDAAPAARARADRGAGREAEHRPADLRPARQHREGAG
jgi:ABC-2 type transport system permease protein